MLSNNSISFQEIYEAYKNKVFNTVISYLQNTEDAEEVTQDVFVEVYRSVSNFKGNSTLSTWIYKISVNKSLDFIKNKKRKKRFAFIVNMFDNESGKLIHDNSDFIHPGILVEQKEKSKILFNTINTLPSNQKTAFILSKIEGLGNKEIADIMQTSVGAVESLLSRAKDNLKKQLINYKF